MHERLFATRQVWLEQAQRKAKIDEANKKMQEEADDKQRETPVLAQRPLYE